MAKEKKKLDPAQTEQEDGARSQVDVDEEAAERISESISEGYINGDLEGF